MMNYICIYTVKAFRNLNAAKFLRFLKGLLRNLVNILILQQMKNQKSN